jgi:hypothetical protein
MAAVLLPVNLASLALLHYSSAQWIAVSAVMVVACNMLLIYKLQIRGLQPATGDSPSTDLGAPANHAGDAPSATG